MLIQSRWKSNIFSPLFDLDANALMMSIFSAMIWFRGNYQRFICRSIPNMLTEYLYAGKVPLQAKALGLDKELIDAANPFELSEMKMFV
jgi:hypothetical protein